MNRSDKAVDGGSKRTSGRFQPGQSGNPRGKLPGTRNRTTLVVEALLDGQAEALTQKAVDMALAGDTTALRLCMERLIPIRRDRTVKFPLPPLKTPADATTALSAILAAVADGALTPAEANEITKSVAAFTAAYQTQELAKRVEAFERARSNSGDNNNDNDKDGGLSEYDEAHAEIRRLAKEAKGETTDVA